MGDTVKKNDEGLVVWLALDMSKDTKLGVVARV